MLGSLSVKYRVERSLHGVEPSVLKSGLQKYMRRGDRERGLWCVIEMDLFSLAREHKKEIAARDKSSEEGVVARVKSLRTNLINRLVVMISEEVNIHNVWLPAVARGMYQRWSSTRDEEGARVYLLSLYLLLLASKKCRIISDYKTIFNLPPYYLPDSEWSTLVSLHRELLRGSDLELYRINYEQGEANALEKTISCAREGRDEALYWCGKILRSPESKRLVAQLWQALQSFQFATSSIEALRFFYQEMTHKERPIYLYHALLLIVLRDKLELGKREERLISSQEANELYAKHMTDGALDVDEFIKDIHTGRKIQDGRFVFATEGAHIEGEDKTFYSERYRKLYVEFKRRLDHHKRRSA